MLDKINQLDIGLFELLNGAGHPALDSFMYVFTAKYPWIPLYALLTGLLVFRYRQRFWVPLLFILLTIAAADQLTSGFMKPFFERLRPCYNPDIVNLFNPGKCGGKFGFASSHAANTMALAVFYFLLFDRKWWTYLLIVWAFLVGYSRIYLGVHYPGDVATGMLIGLGLAWLSYRLMPKRWLSPG